MTPENEITTEYTADDMQPPAPVQGVGTYPTLRQGVVASTGAIPDDGPQSFYRLVDDAYAKLAPMRNSEDALNAREYAARGNTDGVANALKSIAERQALDSKISSDMADETRAKLEEVMKSATSNVAISDVAVRTNNTPEEIVQQTDKGAKAAASQAALEKNIEDGLSFWSTVRGLGYEFLPPAMLGGYDIASIAKSRGVKEGVGFFDGRNEAINGLRNAYYMVEPEKRLEWITSVYDDMQKSWGISKWMAAIRVREILGDEVLDENGWEDWADRIGVGAAMLTGIGAVVKGTKLVKSGNALIKSERAIAAAGGKGAIELAEAAKVSARSKYMEAAGTVAAEFSGVQSAIDLSKLVSLTATKVLPDVITTAASEVTKGIKAPVEQLISDLKDTIAKGGIKADEAGDMLRSIEAVYSPAADPTIHSVTPFKLDEMGNITGQVFYKPEGFSAFLTKEAAEEWARLKDPSGKLKVVPDTTNTAFLVKEDHVISLKARKAELEAQLLAMGEAEKAKKAAKTASKAPKKASEGVGSTEVSKPATEPPKSLASSKPKYGLPKGAEKAAYEKVKALEEKQKGLLQKNGRIPNANSPKRAEYDQLTEAIAAAKEEWIAADNAAKAVAKAADNGTNIAVDITKADSVFDDVSITSIGSYKYTQGVERAAVLFIDGMAKALGMENANIAVVQMSDILRGKVSGAWADEIKAVMLKHPNAGALHIPTPRGSVIVMRSDVQAAYDMRKYMSDFAHEFAHSFEHHFQHLYKDSFQSMFYSWLDAKGIRYSRLASGDVEMNYRMSLEQLMDYRNAAKSTDYEWYVDSWYAGDFKKFKEEEAATKAWASQYSEWFAEQFTKWAYASPTGEQILTDTDKLFIKLVNSIKHIAERLRSYFGGIAAYDEGVNKFLRAHIQAVAGESYAEVSRVGGISEARVTRKGLTSELLAVDAELAAIEDAAKGLKRGYLVQKDVSEALTYRAVGTYSAEDIATASRLATYSGDWALATSSELYADRVIGVSQASRYQNLLTEFVRPHVEKLNKAERVALDNALALGDKEGKVFTHAELAGMDMSPKARDAYYRVRELRDVMYMMRNDVAVKSLRRNGYIRIASPHIELPPDGPNLFGRRVEQISGFMYNAETGKMEDAAKFHERGLVTYELHEPIPVGGSMRKRIAVPENSLKTTEISEVIPYRAGEYRRMYSDEYWVKISGTMDGQEVVQSHRTAKSVREAQAYANAFNKALRMHRDMSLTAVEFDKIMGAFNWKYDEFVELADSGRLGDGATAVVKYNRTDDDFIQNTLSASTNWASKRGEHIPDVYGATSNTVSPLDSIAAEIGNTAYVASTSEWRESHIHRWYNTFRDVLPKPTHSMEPVQAFEYMLRNEGSAYLGQTKEVAMAKSVQDYIVSQMNIPTKEERAMLGTMRTFSEWVEGFAPNSNKMMVVGQALRTTADYPKWLRTISFHSFFGFNPIQLAVQGMNAFNAIAISPIHGIAAGKAMPFYRIALMSDNEAIWRKVAKANKITSLGLGSEEEFVNTVRAIRRSGLLDGINSTSMYGAETGRFGLFNGLIRKVGGAIAFFFNRGEEASRLVSFDIAKREFIKAHPTEMWWSDSNLAKIMERQDDLTQNMTNANMASWQRGWKSVPTQFMQYQVKLYMNLMHSLVHGNTRAFSRAEAAQLLTAHLLVMGTAGNFIFGTRELIGQAVDDAGLSEEQRLYIQQGVVSGLIGSATDGEVQLGIGKRFNTFRFYEDFIEGILDPEKPFLEVLGGAPSAAVINILGGAGKLVTTLTTNGLNETSLKEGLIELGSSSSSAISNAYKAYLASNNFNVVMSKNKGTKQYAVSDGELYLMALGIPPAKESDLQILYKNKLSHDKEIKSAGEELARRAMLAEMALRNGDISSYNVHRAVIANLLAAHASKPADHKVLMNSAYKSEDGTLYKRLIVDEMVRGLETSDVKVNTSLGEY